MRRQIADPAWYAVVCGLIGLGLAVGGVRPAASQTKFTAKLAETSPPTHPDHKAYVFLAKRVAEKSDSQLEIVIFPGMQLGGERDVIEGLQLGSVQLAGNSTSVLGNFEPSLQILDLPFLFRDREHSFRVLDGPIGDELRAKILKAGIRILTFFELGVRYVHDSKKPIGSPSDMKDLKFRVMQNPVHIAMYEALGARAIPMARPEVYPALKQGVLDGLDNALLWYEAMHDYEVAKYLTLGVPVMMPGGALTASEKWYKTLPERLQIALNESAIEFRELQRKLFYEEELKVLERLKQRGIIVTQGNPEPFRKAMMRVWDQFAPKVGGMEKIKAILDTK